MPNPWTGKGNPYTKQEVRDRLQATIDQGKAIIAAGAGTGISAKFIEKGGADLIIIYNSGRFRMAGHGSTAGLMAYGSWGYIDRLMRLGITAEDIPVQRWLLTIILPVGFVLLGIRLLEQAIAILRSRAEGFELADEAAEVLYEQGLAAPDQAKDGGPLPATRAER